MARRRLARSLGHRADQTGLLLAGGNIPLTFQRTLMPRPTMDQAHRVGPVARDQPRLRRPRAGDDPVGRARSPWAGGVTTRTTRRRGAGRRSSPTSSRPALGLALQRTLEQRPGEHLPRAAARTGGFFLTATGVAAVIGVACRRWHAGRSKRRRWLPPVIPAASAMAVAAEVMRRRRAKLDADLPPSTATVNPLRALGIGVGRVARAVGDGAGRTGRRRRDRSRRGPRRAGRRGPPAPARTRGHARRGRAARRARSSNRPSAGSRARRRRSRPRSTSRRRTRSCPGATPASSASTRCSRQGGRYVWTVTPPREDRRAHGRPTT